MDFNSMRSDSKAESRQSVAGEEKPRLYAQRSAENLRIEPCEGNSGSAPKLDNRQTLPDLDVGHFEPEVVTAFSRRIESPCDRPR
jgi:hypothetical protein